MRQTNKTKPDEGCMRDFCLIFYWLRSKDLEKSKGDIWYAGGNNIQNRISVEELGKNLRILFRGQNSTVHQLVAEQ
ncbi:hypothetical protein J4Q44_G00277410 [Coregonus suidteri]|uniref:Uncharacterized protein n=1 Tax=Coregonus suidteri TaxID=861788 RepID=A0AAN8L1E9_9TELE